MFKRILIGYDGSQPAEKAFRTGLSLAASYQAALYVLTMVQQQDFASELSTLVSSMSPWITPEGNEADLASRSIQDQQERFRQRFMLLRDTAEQQQIVPIFEVLVGRRGKGSFERWLDGPRPGKQRFHQLKFTRRQLLPLCSHAHFMRIQIQMDGTVGQTAFG